MLIVSLGGLGLILAAGEAFAGAGAAQGTTAHSAARPSIARCSGITVDTVRTPGLAWWTERTGRPMTNLAQRSRSHHRAMSITPTRMIVPWDAVHRFPPNVAPSTRPYVPDCTSQTVTVPRDEGARQTADIDVIRCY